MWLETKENYFNTLGILIANIFTTCNCVPLGCLVRLAVIDHGSSCSLKGHLCGWSFTPLPRPVGYTHISTRLIISYCSLCYSRELVICTIHPLLTFQPPSIMSRGPSGGNPVGIDPDNTVIYHDLLVCHYRYLEVVSID